MRPFALKMFSRSATAKVRAITLTFRHDLQNQDQQNYKIQASITPKNY